MNTDYDTKVAEEKKQNTINRRLKKAGIEQTKDLNVFVQYVWQF